MAATCSGQALAAHFRENLRAVGGKRCWQIAHRDRRIEARAEAARCDLADRLAGGGVREQQRAFAYRRAALGPQADAAARRAFFEVRENLLRAGKTARAGAAAAAALLHRPFQRALDRRRRGVDVVAIETEPGFQPQAVARAETDRKHIRVFQQRRHQRLGLCGRNRNLKAVLAGIAGARDEAVEAGDLARSGIHEPHRRDVCTKFGQRGFRFRPLQRDQAAIGQRIDDAGIRKMRAQMRLVLGLAGGVDDQKQMIAEIRHHQVVENAAVLVGELRVALPSRRNRHDVLRHQPLQRAAPHPRPGRIWAAARAGPYARRRTARLRSRMQMLLQHAGRVLHRHLVAGEGNQLAAARHVERVQWGAFQGSFIARQHSGTLKGSGDQPPKNPKESPICRCA